MQKFKKQRLGTLIKLLNPLILWCCGWKRKTVTYNFFGNRVVICRLYLDPEGKHGWVSGGFAIEVCESRIKKT